MYWPKLNSAQIEKRVHQALEQNIHYRNTPILGIPATYLDPEIFYPDAPFLTNAPFLSTLVTNPNHIGCHTLGHTEKLFKGTQELEKELIQLCACEILGGEKDRQDGYVASGSTEGNLEALWIYRNFFRNTFNAKVNQIGVIFSEDSHYSVSKGINLLNLQAVKIPVDRHTRLMPPVAIDKAVQNARKSGIRFFIVVLNMSTTMFGSVDDIDTVTGLLLEKNVPFRLHVDAAFGGFIYPFTHPSNPYTFKNPHITSFSIDAHKLLQTPYGTGIFLIRKGYMQHVRTTEAQYVPGTDHTLCGSRSGANAVAVWMVLHNYGSEGWKAKTRALVDLTTDTCTRLNEEGILYYRNPYMNIITIDARYLESSIADKYFLVADSYEKKTEWWKIVVMPHTTRGVIDGFINEIQAHRP